MRQLLVNADDFGLCQGITDGIITAHQHGIVTSTSIVASGRGFVDAVVQARGNPKLGVGVHLTLVEEYPVAAACDIPTLTQGDGRFPKNYAALLPGLLLGRIHLKDVEREFRAQIEKCINAGLTPTHLDSHQHVHALPPLFRMVLRLAREYGIYGMRLPRDSPRWRGKFPCDGFAQKYALSFLARGDAFAFRDPSAKTCQGAAGIFDSGVLSEERLLAIIDRLPEGTTELVCHPGAGGAESATLYGHWHYNWETELAALTSAAVKTRLTVRQIELINYSTLNS
jgi:hopanoid biosynthesis associated protein HpnK